MTEAVVANFFDPKHILDPLPFYNGVWKQDTPIVQLPGSDTFVIFSEELIRQACRRTEDFSSDFGAQLIGQRADDPDVREISSQGWPFAATLMIADPPRHTRTRKIVTAALSKKNVDAVAGDIRSLAVELIEAFVGKGSCELVSEFAIPFPITVIKHQIGLGHVPIERIKSWSDAVADRAAGFIDKDREIECAKLILEYQSTMMAEIEKRQASPKDDVLQFILDGRETEDPPLADDEVLSMLQQLMVGGNETTTSTLGAGVLRLCQNPEIQREARQDPSIISRLVDEVLRIDSPAQGVWRKAAQDTELGGVAIPAGAMIMLRLAAANRDPAIYEDAADFCPHRKALNRHVAFGSGIHTCVGHFLARAELQIAFTELLARLGDIRLEEEFAPGYNYNTMVRGPTDLRISFEPIHASR